MVIAVYCLNHCSALCPQPYWTNDKSTSSFGKALQTAHGLKDLIQAKLTPSSPPLTSVAPSTGKQRQQEQQEGQQQRQGQGSESQSAGSNTTGTGAGAPSRVLALRSCHYQSHGAEPAYTNWTEDFKG